MGLPSVNIEFIAAAQQMPARAERGIVGMILRDAEMPEGPVIITGEADIPEGASVHAAEQIRLALIGYTTAPRRVEVFCVGGGTADEGTDPTGTVDYAAALGYFEVSRVDYLCAPTCDTDGQKTAIIDWVKRQRDEGNRVKAVLPDAEADHEGIINYATPSVEVGGKSYDAEQFCPRIAGILAGTPSSASCTFAPIPEATGCTKMARSQLDAEIDKGRFVVFYDGEKVKVGRGVNSLTTIREGQNPQFKKIRIIASMDMIRDDLVRLIEENYIGRYANNYDNKCVVLSAVMDYLSQLVVEGILDSYTVGIDVQANKRYLESKGIDTKDMSEDELKKADTDEKLFLAASMGLLDAMEDVTIGITV